MTARRVAKRPTEHEHRPTKVEEAKAALADAKSSLERWERQAAQRAIDVQDAERSLGQSVVDSTPADQPVNKASTEEALQKAGQNLATLRAEHEAAVAAVEATRKRIDEAHRDVWRAEAATLRGEAARFRGEARPRQEKTADLLRQLQEHEGVEYGPKDVNVQQQVMMFGKASVSIPHTQRLLNEATTLIQQAEALDQQAANTPEARQEHREAERRSREETIKATNEENWQRHLDGLPGRVVDTPVGAG